MPIVARSLCFLAALAVAVKSGKSPVRRHPKRQPTGETLETKQTLETKEKSVKDDFPMFPMIIHHLQSPKAFAIGNTFLDRDGSGESSIRVFCYAFIKPLTDGGPEARSKEVRKMLAHCDGSAMYSNYDDPVLGITKAHEGASGKNGRSSRQFLSVYEKLAHSDDLQAKYDWFVDLESDHFVRTKVLKPLLAKLDHSQAIMLTNANVRVLSTGLLREMKQQWGTLGERAKNGCPKWGVLANDACQGDVTLPMIPSVMKEGSAKHDLLGGHFWGFEFFRPVPYGAWMDEGVQVEAMTKFANGEYPGGVIMLHADAHDSSCPNDFLDRLLASRGSDGLTKRMTQLLDKIISGYASCLRSRNATFDYSYK